MLTKYKKNHKHFPHCLLLPCVLPSGMAHFLFPWSYLWLYGWSDYCTFVDTLEPEAAYIQKQITGAKRETRYFFVQIPYRLCKSCFFKRERYTYSQSRRLSKFRVFQTKHLHSIKSNRCCFSMVQFLLPLDYVTLRDCTFQSE